MNETATPKTKRAAQRRFENALAQKIPGGDYGTSHAVKVDAVNGERTLYG